MYARVSESKDFINLMIDQWADSSTIPPKGVCTNDPRGFYDKDGTKYNCRWYEEEEDRCDGFGASYAHAGITANDACCVCGGGIRSGTVAPTHHPTKSPTSKPTSAPTPNNKVPPPTKPPVPYDRNNGRPFWNHLF